jgi:hypothetical protein
MSGIIMTRIDSESAIVESRGLSVLRVLKLRLENLKAEGAEIIG